MSAGRAFYPCAFCGAGDCECELRPLDPERGLSPRDLGIRAAVEAIQARHCDALPTRTNLVVELQDYFIWLSKYRKGIREKYGRHYDD